MDAYADKEGILDRIKSLQFSTITVSRRIDTIAHATRKKFSKND